MHFQATNFNDSSLGFIRVMEEQIVAVLTLAATKTHWCWVRSAEGGETRTALFTSVILENSLASG